MIVKTIAAIGLIVAVSAAPAFAWGGKRGGNDSAGAGISGSFASTTAPDNGGAPVTSASEPLAALAVGLGLLGARLLRRR